MSFDMNDAEPQKTGERIPDGTFAKVLACYDIQWGYSSRCVDLLRFMASKGL